MLPNLYYFFIQTMFYINFFNEKVCIDVLLPMKIKKLKMLSEKNGIRKNECFCNRVCTQNYKNL